jgi:formate hydrogenlyase subunit 3/multisubunit Na+/H+ antiporter MnhD subunit
VARGAGGQFNPALWGNILVLVGTLTLFIGTVQSIKQSNYLKLLAFSSIGQVGYIIFALGSSLVAWSSDSPAVQLLAGVIFLGAILHSLNHGVFKSLLFLVGGSLLYATNTRDLNRLGGLLAVMPVTGILAAIASYSISGMPASNGFVSKWLMISGNFLAGSNNLLLTLAGIVALFTAAFTLACYVKFFGLAFTSAGANWRLKKEIKEAPRQMLAPKIFLAAVCLSQAFIPGVYVNLIGRSINNSKGFLFPWAGSGVLQSNGFSLKILGDQTFLAATGPLIIFFIIVALVILSRWLRQSAGAKEVAVPAWLCGYQDLSSDNVYTDSNMFSDLKKFFWWTGRAPDKVVDEEADEDSSDKSGGGTQL